MTKTVTTVGMICGTTMEKKIRRSPAPSIRPASMVSSGTPLIAAEEDHGVAHLGPDEDDDDEQSVELVVDGLQPADLVLPEQPKGSR